MKLEQTKWYYDLTEFFVEWGKRNRYTIRDGKSCNIRSIELMQKHMNLRGKDPIIQIAKKANRRLKDYVFDWRYFEQD